MQNSEPIIKSIQEQIKFILESHPLPNGAQAYHQFYQSEIQMDDESITEVLILQECRHLPENDGSDEIMERVNKEIFDLIPPHLFQTLKQVHKTDLLIIYASAQNDTFQIQLADHTFHITTHYSGQY